MGTYIISDLIHPTYCRRGRCGPPQTRLLLETCQIRCTTMSHQCGASFQCVGLVVYSKTEGRVSQSRLSSHLHTRYEKSPAIFASGRSLTELLRAEMHRAPLYSRQWDCMAHFVRSVLFRSGLIGVELLKYRDEVAGLSVGR